MDQLLPCAAQAAFNSANKQHAPLCLPNTRVDVLARIREWANGSYGKAIFWLYGMAFTTLATQLANRSPDLKSYIHEAIANNTDISNLGLYDQWNRLILQPLSKLEKSSVPLPLVLVIDALDECDGEEDVRLVLQIFATAKFSENVHLRIFVTSRPETAIRHGIYDITEVPHQDFIFHDISQSIIEHDISVFFRHNLEIIGRERILPIGPSEQTISLLVQRAGGLFIYAAMTCRFIRQDSQFAQRRLALFLQYNNAVLPPEKKLDEIYTTVLTHSVNGEYNEQEIKKLRKLFGQIVGSIVVLFDSLSVASVVELLDILKEEIDQTLARLHSVLDIPESQDGVIRLLHPSFRDFLLDEQRCLNPHFFIDGKHAHHNLFTNCLRVMSSHLRRDICNLRVPGARAVEIKKSEVDQHIPLYVQYACRYWVRHLKQSNIHSHDYSNIHRFLKKHFLHWLEALAVMGCMSEGVLMVKILDSMLKVSGLYSRVVVLVTDPLRISERRSQPCFQS